MTGGGMTGERPRNGGDWRFTPAQDQGSRRSGGDWRFTPPAPAPTMALRSAVASTPAPRQPVSPPTSHAPSAGWTSAPSGGGGSGGGELVVVLLVLVVGAALVLCRVIGRLVLWAAPLVWRLVIDGVRALRERVHRRSRGRGR
jgi:hypothetical protein